MTMLAEYFRSELYPLAMEAYLVALEDLDREELSSATRSAIKRSKFMPSGAELREYAKEFRRNRSLAAETHRITHMLKAAQRNTGQLGEMRRDIATLAESKSAETLEPPKPRTLTVSAEDKERALRAYEKKCALTGRMG